MFAFVCPDNDSSGPATGAVTGDLTRSPEYSASAKAEHSTASSQLRDADAKPNVVMLLVDDLGYADTEVYGAPSTDTPNINRMAAQGARFTQWYVLT